MLDETPTTTPLTPSRSRRLVRVWFLPKSLLLSCQSEGLEASSITFSFTLCLHMWGEPVLLREDASKELFNILCMSLGPWNIHRCGASVTVWALGPVSFEQPTGTNALRRRRGARRRGSVWLAGESTGDVWGNFYFSSTGGCWKLWVINIWEHSVSILGKCCVPPRPGW